MWTYQRLENVPNGVIVRDARQLVPHTVAAGLLKIPGFRVAHLADIVRLHALRASSRPGWFVDCDTHWL